MIDPAQRRGIARECTGLLADCHSIGPAGLPYGRAVNYSISQR